MTQENYSKTFQTYVTKGKNFSKFIHDNLENLVFACQEQAQCFASKEKMQDRYQACADLGYKFTLQQDENGKWERKRHLRNEWTAVKWIGENADLVFNTANFHEWEDKKFEGLRGVMNAVKALNKTADTTIEADEADEADEYDTPIENLRVDAQLGRKRSFAELLKNFQDIVQAQGDDFNEFLDYAISEEGAKITEAETAMSK